MPQKNSNSAVFTGRNPGVDNIYDYINDQNSQRPYHTHRSFCEKAGHNYACAGYNKAYSAEFLAFLPGNFIFPTPFCAQADDGIILYLWHEIAAYDQEKAETGEYKAYDVYGKL